jgi:hypothetical protein
MQAGPFVAKVKRIISETSVKGRAGGHEGGHIILVKIQVG